MNAKTVQVYAQIKFKRGRRKMLWIVPGVSLILLPPPAQILTIFSISLSKLRETEKTAGDVTLQNRQN